MIYLDHAATCPLSEAAKKAFLEVPFGNPNSEHMIGYKAFDYLIRAKVIIAEQLNCRPNEVYFTSGATEACNWAIKIMENLCVEIYYHNYEHSAVLLPCKQQKCKGKKIGIAQMLANNVLGTVYALPAKTQDNIIFCDGTAAIGHMRFNFSESGIDMLAFGGHKFGAPIGIGCLIIREGIDITPVFPSEHGVRGGTPAPALAYSMARALEYENAHIEENNKKYKIFREYFLNNLNCHDNSASAGKYLPYNLNISFEGIPGYLMVNELNDNNICVTTGSACGDITASPIDVFLENGLTSELAKTSIRITFGHENTVDEIKEVIDIMKKSL